MGGNARTSNRSIWKVRGDVAGRVGDPDGLDRIITNDVRYHRLIDALGECARP